MPITSSAKKALRAGDRKRVYNLATKKSVDAVTKEFKKLILVKDKKGAAKILPAVYKALDKAAKTHFIDKNTASRKKSRLSAMVKKLA
ncbi:TPA: 30S ribosomal protein S20 [Candidatus Taylorbacteria bacterium]|nr:30S ribosomal protein S20 [Candidatus Taylorbacteria bacterium]